MKTIEFNRASAEDQRLADLVEEIMARVQLGETCDVDQYIVQYPEYADRLRGWIGTMTAMADLGHSLSVGTANRRASGSGSKIDADSPQVREPAAGILGDFRILCELGRGGMGVVYEAEQISLGRHVALKVLPFAAMLDKQQLARFKNEARAAATLDHPNIVAIHSVGAERGVHYYAMQLIEGRSLAEIIAELKPGRPPSHDETAPAAALINHATAADTAKAALPTVRAAGGAAFSTIPPFESREYYRTIARLGIQTAEALDHAHQNGILHRDIKPANLLLDDDGKLWITDFGLARIERDAGMTMTGDLLGTLRYMSPEQALAKRVVVDHRSDIYSLGVTLYELLTLQPAFSGEDRQELLRQIAFEEPSKPRELGARIPQDLETIVLKAIEKNPTDRYPTAHELATDLTRFISDLPIMAKRQSTFVAGRKWASRHRILLSAIVTTLLVCALVTAASIGWIVRDRTAHQMAAADVAGQALQTATVLIEQAQWKEALSAINRSADALEIGGNTEDMRLRAQQLRKDVAMAMQLDKLGLQQGEPIPGGKKLIANGHYEIGGPDLGRLYAKAFVDYGCSVETMNVEEAAAIIEKRPIKLQIVFALDRWARWKKDRNESGWEKLCDIARLADRDQTRNQLRELLKLSKAERKTALVSLAKTIGRQNLQASTAHSLAVMLLNVDADRAAISVLRIANQRHPDDYLNNYELAQAIEHEDSTNVDDLIRYYTAAVALRPDDALSHNNLGKSLEEKGLREEARAHFEEAVRLDPQFVTAQQNLGLAYMGAGLPEQAISHCREAVRLNPNDPWSLAALGDVLEKTASLDEAIATYRQAVRLKPDFAEVHNALGYAFASQKKWGDAIVNYREAIRAKPTLVDAHNGLGIALYESGDPEAGIASFDEGLKLDNTSVKVLTNRGLALHDLGRLQEAIKTEQKLCDILPPESRSYLTLARWHNEAGECSEAKVLSQKAAQNLGPTDSAGRNLIAWFLATAECEDVRDGRLALKLATESCELSHYETSTSLDSLAAAYAELGDFASAVKWSEKAVQLANDGRQNVYVEHLNTFKSGKPWRSTAPTSNIITQSQK